MTSKPTLYIMVNNHFDPTWRRCWQRRFEFRGQTFASYADIEEYYILDNLVLARSHPEYKFEVESVLVLETFFERHPECRTEILELARAGRFTVTGAGYLITDGNMILGESLIRNFLHGLLWVEDILGQTTTLAIRNDFFGNPAQLPQILRGCEIKWATGMSYSRVQGSYWRGLDGSTIFTDTIPEGAHGPNNGWHKYRPCPACRGQGGSCPRCRGRGIDEVALKLDPPGELHEAILHELGFGRLLLSPEEVLPNPELFDWIRTAQATVDVRFALEEEVAPLLRAQLDRVDAPPAEWVHPQSELNPNNSGVLVSRIRTKQNVRRQEYAMYAAEWLGVMAALRGQPYPRAELLAVWKPLFFTMFHDAITATHVDPAYAELESMWAEIDHGLTGLTARLVPALNIPTVDTLTVLNPHGQPASGQVTALVPGSAAGLTLTGPDGRAAPILSARELDTGQVEVQFAVSNVPGWGQRSLTVQRAVSAPVASPLAQPVIENEFFRVEADDHGLTRIWDKRQGCAVCEMDEYRPGELLLEHDEGSPWATLHADQTRLPLAEFTQLVAAEQGAGWQRLVFAAHSPFRAGFVMGGVHARVTVTLVEGIERVDFHASVEWDTYNHRLRVAFPVPFHGTHQYEVPYGVLERAPYAPDFHWYAANGDWPTINWAGVQGQQGSVAVFNRGLPSYRMEPGRTRGDVILLSVLRSPAIPTYLHEPQNYIMTDFDGMRDAGQHEFDFALAAYATGLAQSSVVADAEGYTGGLLAVPGRVELPELPLVLADNVRAAALKWAEKGDALIVRLVEFRGLGGTVQVRLPKTVRSAARVNLLERQPQALEIREGSLHFSLRPWEIASLRLEMAQPKELH